MKIALVHDWLTGYAGAERVFEALLGLYPGADLFAVCDFLPDTQRQFLNDRDVTTTFIQRMPGARRHHRAYLPLMPLAIEQLDLSGYDLVLSDSHAVAKGVLTGPDQLHVSYVHTPLRYAWDLQHQYLRESGLNRGARSWIARYLLHRIRQWDLRTAQGVDEFVANSRYIARRIRKVYRREAQVIYPPVDITAFKPCDDKADYFLTASRLVPYKRVDLIVSAFARMPDQRLKVIGDGPARKRIEALARGKRNIEILGFQPTEVLRELMGHAKAFVFAAEEDFGIAPVEAQACGTPVIAFARGGARETVVEGRTGLFFAEQTPEAIEEAVRRSNQYQSLFDPALIRAHAERFSPEHFSSAFAALINQVWSELNNAAAGVPEPPQPRR